MEEGVFTRCNTKSRTSDSFPGVFDPPEAKKARPEIGRSPSRNILIADGDVALGKLLSSELAEQNLSVTVVPDGAEAYAMLQGKVRSSLLIVALNLPGIDGLTLIEKVRLSHPRLPVMVLTAHHGLEHKIAAFQKGADDYVTKPFSLIELQARIHALLRRNSGTIPRISQVGDLILDREERRVERLGRRIELTPREFHLLEAMMRTPGCPVSRATLLDEVWNLAGEPTTNIVDVYLKYVRDKVNVPGERRLIHTIRGFGYVVREDEEDSQSSAAPEAQRPALQFEPSVCLAV